MPLNAIGGPIYEYACHEGNSSLPNILADARNALHPQAASWDDAHRPGQVGVSGRSPQPPTLGSWRSEGSGCHRTPVGSLKSAVYAATSLRPANQASRSDWA